MSRETCIRRILRQTCLHALSLLYPNSRREAIIIEDIPKINSDDYLLASTDALGAKSWRQPNGYLHRENGPAVLHANGMEEWRQSGRLHREGGPAVVRPEEVARKGRHPKEEWWQDGERHREDGPAIIHPDGREEWCINGILHREDGPARTWPDGREEWYRDDRLHRTDGPARINADGSEEWWEDGFKVS